ncbi:hypothetical protein Mapa_013539 [Marchantia paleacea]|nr:hypothetical protein Mapa_013539 [Marchantia paleacea]
MNIAGPLYPFEFCSVVSYKYCDTKLVPFPPFDGSCPLLAQTDGTKAAFPYSSTSAEQKG